MENKIKAIIFDWGRTLFDSKTKKEFSGAEQILNLCIKKGYRLAVASLVSIHANATMKERKNQIEKSSLRDFFEMVEVTDKNKDEIFDKIVLGFNLPRNEILIIDDRVVRGIKYGNFRNHPTVWLQRGKFANELPNKETGKPTFIINDITKLESIIT